MKRFLLALILMTGALWSQPLTTPINLIPDCLVFFDFTTNASSANFDNRFIGCKTWYVAYTSTGFPALTLTFQDAPDASGVPGAFVAFAGTITEGVNPNVALTQASTIMYGYYPWLRLTLTGATAGAARRIRGTFYGYRQTPVSTVLLPAALTVTANQGTANTAVNRWPVYLSDGANPQGVVANPFFNRLSDGAAAQGVVANPLFSRLSDGAAAQGLVANPLFSRLSDGAAAQGTTTNPLRVRLSNGTGPIGELVNDPLITGPAFYVGVAPAGWTPVIACSQNLPITIAGAGVTQIVPAISLDQIQICHISFSLSGASNVTLVYGTGANCAVGTTAVSGAYTNILGLALDLDSRSYIFTPLSKALCLNVSAAVTGGGMVVYSQY